MPKSLLEYLKEGREDEIFFDELYPKPPSSFNWDLMEGVKDTPDPGPPGYPSFPIKKRDPLEYLYEKEDMNIPQARQTLRKAIPQGEDIVAMNGPEFNWLQANKPGWFGSGKKHKKSGLRSFVKGNDPSMTGGGDSSYEFGIGNKGPMNVRGWAEERGYLNKQDSQAAIDQHAKVADLSQYGPNSGSSGGGVPQVPNPLAGAGGSETRTPQGPGSVTNPNDPYGIQKKIAGGASDLIDQEYTAPTLTPEQRIAATSDQTTRARAGVDTLQGTGQKAYSDAAGVGERVSNQTADQVGSQSFLGGKGVDQYMNPEIENVINRNTDNAMDAMAIRRNQLVSNAQMAGAATNDRAALERGVMQAEGLSNLGDQNAQLMAQAYRNASGLKTGDMDRQVKVDAYNQSANLDAGKLNLAGADTMMAGTGEGRDAAVTDIDLLSKVGADVEGRDQNVIDETMGDFYEKRDWGKNNLALASNIAGTNPTGSTTTTTGAPQHKKRDKFGRIIAGAASGWLASGGNPWGAAAGGVGGLMS